jgi:trehalose utilization protein
MANKIRVTAWNEFRHEKSNEYVKSIYPDGIHGLIKQFLETQDDIEVTLAALDDPDNGLPDEVLNNTDVLIWWGHMAHHEVPDALVEKIRHRVYTKGMGLIVLHSGHHSKVFRQVVGTNGNLSWGRDQKEVVWNLLPSHPIAAGIPDHFTLTTEELYCEPFYVPQPDALVFGSWFEDGFIFRSGLCYLRGAGKVFYFQPGHEFCRSFYSPYVQRIICNAVKWAAPNEIAYPIEDGCPQIQYKLSDQF